MSSSVNDLPPLDLLLSSGPDAPSFEDRLELAALVRSGGDDASRCLDEFFLRNLTDSRVALLRAKEKQSELGARLARLTACPWHTATFVSAVETSEGSRAVVLHGQSQRVVALNDGIDLSELKAGDEIFLADNLNLVVAKSPRGIRPGGETALFERKLPNGQLVLKSRDEELIVNGLPELTATPLETGDLIHFDRTLWLAREKIEPAHGRHSCIVEDVPDIHREQIGGLEICVDNLFSALTMALDDPEELSRYGLGGRQSILLCGAPGCGKTLLVKAGAAEVTRLSGKRCRVAVVKPAEFESPWVGETQANIRNFFKSLREAAEEGFVVAFFDEIESIGRIRGGVVGQHSDKALAALLAELDGFADRKNIAIVSATNRKDLLDPALAERLSDIEIVVPRPNLRAARAIFDIHLSKSLPFSPNGSEAQATREALIESTVSRFYSPNSDNEISVIRFRDGKERTVLARELVSGRIFEQVCRHMARAARLRKLSGAAEPGLRLSDVDDAAAEAFKRMRSSLSIENAHSYLSDLPQDMAIVSVEPIVHKVSQPGQYLNK